MFTDVLDSLLDVNTELMQVQCGVYCELEDKDNHVLPEDDDDDDDVFEGVDGVGLTGNTRSNVISNFKVTTKEALFYKSQ